MNTCAWSEISSVHLTFDWAGDDSGWLAGKPEVHEVFRPTGSPGPELRLNSGGPAPSRAQGTPAAPPQAPRPPLAKPRWGFTLPAFNLLRSYAKVRFPGNAHKREEFENATPEASELGWLLDVAEIVLEAVDELEIVRQHARREDQKLAAKRRAGGRR